MLNESFSERHGYWGCLGPALCGAIIFAVLGWFFASGQGVMDEVGMPVGIEFLGALMGACVGIAVGGLGGFVFDRVMTAKQRREDEF